MIKEEKTHDNTIIRRVEKKIIKKAPNAENLSLNLPGIAFK
jgi:hypothetical protein